MISIFWAILALGVIILVHEFGHYIMARWMGVHVEVFSIGYGKRLFGKKIAGTDFRVSVFPLGGYAKMYGDITEEVAADIVKSKKRKKDIDDQEKSPPQIEEISPEKSFFNKPRWRRALILIGGGLFNIIFAVIVIWIINMVGREVQVYKEESPVLGGVIENTPAWSAGLKEGDRILSINGKDMDTWEEVEIEIMLNPEQDLDITYQRGGERRSVRIKAMAVTQNRIGFIGLLKNYPLHIGRIIKGGEAERINLKKGDIIAEINGIKIEYWTQGVDLIRKSPGKELLLKVMRNEKQLIFKATPQSQEEKPGESAGKLGFQTTAPTEIVNYNIIGSFAESIKENINFGKLFVVSIGKLIKGTLSIRAMSGPIEVTRFTSEAAEQGAIPFIWLMAFISLNLGLVNLAPIPLFDGGSLLILGIEGIRRKDFSMQFKERLMQFGFFFLVAFFLLVMYFDLVKLFN